MNLDQSLTSSWCSLVTDLASWATRFTSLLSFLLKHVNIAGFRPAGTVTQYSVYSYWGLTIYHRRYKTLTVLHIRELFLMESSISLLLCCWLYKIGCMGGQQGSNTDYMWAGHVLTSWRCPLCSPFCQLVRLSLIHFLMKAWWRNSSSELMD